MPKIHSHSDTKLDAEFDNIYEKVDMFIVDAVTPRSPKPGTYWFNPATSKLKIFINIQQGWANIN